VRVEAVAQREVQATPGLGEQLLAGGVVASRSERVLGCGSLMARGEEALDATSATVDRDAVQGHAVGFGIARRHQRQLPGALERDRERRPGSA
jgi:hypothetical protein